jgi:hypothetical protein
VEQADPGELRRATERWFIRSGLPHLIRDYNVREDILTRAAPVLTLVFLAELAFGGERGWHWWQNVLGLVAEIAIVVVIVVMVNRLRDRKPLALPDSVGVIEISIFLLVPPALRLTFGDDVREAANTFVSNVLILLVVYLVTSYGVLPTMIWALRQLLTQFRSVGTLLARSLPLLLLVTMFMFFNAELWKVVDDLPPGFLAIAIGILVLAGSAFVLLFQRTEIDEVSHFDWWSDIHEATSGTPVADVSVSALPDPPALERLQRGARINVGVLLFFLQATQIIVVTLAVTAFYVVFGMFTIQDSTILQWTGSDAIEDVVTTRLWGAELGPTGELLRTALFVGAIAGLQFTVTALTDQQYRQQFNREVTGELRRAMAVRGVYLARLVSGSGSGAEPTPTPTGSGC